MDWDDLRFVLAVRRAGSALGAAKELCVNQSTVVRRIAQIEERLGLDLFERKQSGYVVTCHGIAAADAAERIEAEVRALEHELNAAKRGAAKIVRLTTSEALAYRAVAPFLREFQKLHPDVRIELITDDRRLDLARGEADVALRGGSTPEGAGIVARRLPQTAWALYCSQGYAAEHGAPASREEIARHEIIGMDGRMALLPGPQWLKAAAPNNECRFSSNSLMNLLYNLRAGLGVATLPCMIGDAEPDLMRCFPPPPELLSEFWLIVREEVKSAPHVRAFADFLAERLYEARPNLHGAVDRAG
jgi:DNA-binding transcriptional LysR family regulator